METVSGWCPLCEIEVNYEPDEELDGKLFCPECGQTSEMAEKAKVISAASSRKKAVGNIFKNVGYTLAALIAIGCLYLFSTGQVEKGSIAYKAVVGGAAGAGIAAIIMTIVMLFRYIRVLFNRLKPK